MVAIEKPQPIPKTVAVALAIRPSSVEEAMITACTISLSSPCRLDGIGGCKEKVDVFTIILYPVYCPV